MIESLTPEQEAKFPEYVNKWVKIGLNTDPTNFEKAIEAAKKSYKIAELPEPQVFLGPFNTPLEGCLAYEALPSLIGVEFEDNDAINNRVKEIVAEKLANLPSDYKPNLSYYVFGCQEYWLSHYDYFQNECGLEICKKLEGLQDMARVCGWWIPTSMVCIFTHRPSEIHRDAQNRAHNENGPAIKFRGDYDGCDVYVVHGVRVPKRVVTRQYTAEDIKNETNAEVRRVMVEFYGAAKYIKDIGAEVVDSDDWGTLYKVEQPGDETLMMVKVVNSTEEPDGSFKDYYIRVDPNAYGGLKTARAAVASTFREKDGSFVFAKPEDYDPDIET